MGQENITKKAVGWASTQRRQQDNEAVHDKTNQQDKIRSRHDEITSTQDDLTSGQVNI